jgi:hypothetical protein
MFKAQDVFSNKQRGEYTLWLGDTKDGHYDVLKIEGTDIEAEMKAEKMMESKEGYRWSFAVVTWHPSEAPKTFGARDPS